MTYRDPGGPCIDCGAVAVPPAMHPASRCETRGEYPNHYPVDLGPVCANCCGLTLSTASAEPKAP